MDDALVLHSICYIKAERTVLILVVMDDALVLVLTASLNAVGVVLILVVMDDALVPVLLASCTQSNKSLNPCCNG